MSSTPEPPITSAPLPRELGYRMPAEWEPHAATWISWPHNVNTWPGNFEPIPAVYAELVRALAAGEPVHIAAGGETVMRQAQELLDGVPNVMLHDIRTNDTWMRDHGPTFLVGPPGAQPALVDWQYNAWGGKYPPYDLDNAVPRQIADLFGYRRFEVDIVMEGGAIEPNGRGTLLTTDTCLLNPNRNPGLSRADIEQYLRDYLNVSKVLWLSGEIVGDDTDGHIDEVTRFVSPTMVLTMVCEDRQDPNFTPLDANLTRLRGMTDQDGHPLEIVTLPLPKPVYYEEHRLPASYANFYIGNRTVVVPQFDDPNDQKAVDLLGQLFPDREITPINARQLAWGLGAFHCITQQQPLANEVE